MTRKVKRFVALTVAVILLVSAAFASLAEEFTEGTETPVEVEVIETPEVIETSEAIQETSVVEEVSEATESNPEPQAEETVAAGETEEYTGKDNDYDVIIDDFDAGTVETNLAETLFPNGGAPVEDADVTVEPVEAEMEVTGNNPAPQEAPEAASLRILPENGQAIRVGEQAVLIADSESEIAGVITWEVLDETREEDPWIVIGLGKRLVVDVTEETLNGQLRFVLEDGSASEIFVMKETEEAEEQLQETEEQTVENHVEEKTAEKAEETEAQTEIQNSEEIAETPANQEAVNNAAAVEEQVEEPVRAWISAEIENNTVALTAQADVELDENIVWQMKANDDAEWRNIWYGKTCSVEITDENANSVIRFKTVDKVFSEEFRLMAQEPEAEETELEETEAEETEIEELEDEELEDEELEDEETETEETDDEEQESEAEETEIEEPEIEEQETEEEETEAEEDEELADEEASLLPEERSVTFTITGDEEELHLGDVAHFNAELVGYEELDYTIQWQMSEDNENWEDIPEANEMQMDLVLTEENSSLFWRVTVLIRIPQPGEEQSEEEAADEEQSEEEQPDEELTEKAPAEEALPDEEQPVEAQADETPSDDAQPDETQTTEAQNDEGSEE